MTEKTPKGNGGEVQVPIWVAIVTYILCWGLAVFLLAGPGAKTDARYYVGALLLVFPMVGFRPLELLRDIRWGRPDK